MGVVAESVRGSSRIGTGWGFAVVILGVLAVMTPFVSGVAVTTMVAILITAAGLAMTLYAFKAGSFGKGLLQLLFGGITVLCGIAMFMQPVMSMFTLAGILMVYFLMDGIFGVVGGFRLKPTEGWGWLVISGISSIVLAALIYAKWPVSGAIAIGLLVGIRLIFAGWSIAMLGVVGDAASDEIQAVGDEIREAAAEQE